MDKIKIVVGVILIIISFIYLIRNPGQSMIDGMMKQSKKRFDKAKANEAANQTDTDPQVSENSDDTKVE